MDPYVDILKTLLEKIDGCVGAGFVDYEGEAVQLHGKLENYSHRLHLAYQGILLNQIHEIHQSQIKSLKYITTIHKNRCSILKPLKCGYYLVLTLSSCKHLFKALQHIEEVAHELNQDIS